MNSARQLPAAYSQENKRHFLCHPGEQISISDEYFPTLISLSVCVSHSPLFIKEIPLLWQQSFQEEKKKKQKGLWLPPLIAEEDIVEVIIDMQQFLGDFLIGHAGDELHDAVLHGPAGPVQLLGNTGTSAEPAGNAFCHVLLPLKRFVLILKSHRRSTCLFIKPDVCRMQRKKLPPHCLPLPPQEMGTFSVDEQVSTCTDCCCVNISTCLYKSFLKYKNTILRC